MNDKTRKITLIVLISLSLLGSILFFTLFSIVTSSDMYKETLKESVQLAIEESEKNPEQQQLYSIYTQGKSADELVDQSLKGMGVIKKFVILQMVLHIIMIVTTIKGPNKNRMALKYLSILNLILSFGILSIAILVISCIKSKDVPCEKPVPPELEPVNTFKLPVYIIGFLAVWLLVYNGLLSKIFPQLETFADAKPVLFEVVFYLILAAFVFILFRKEFIRDFKAFIHNFGTYHNFIAKGFFWIMLLNFGTGIVLTLIVKTTSENQAALMELPLWFMIIIATILGPMVEEGIYRGILGKFIKNKVAFVIISSLLFAAMHVVTITSLPESPMQYLFLIQYGVMGIVLSLNYVRTKNIFSSYMIHMLMNAVATTMMSALILL